MHFTLFGFDPRSLPNRVASLRRLVWVVFNISPVEINLPYTPTAKIQYCLRECTPSQTTRLNSRSLRRIPMLGILRAMLTARCTLPTSWVTQNLALVLGCAATTCSASTVHLKIVVLSPMDLWSAGEPAILLRLRRRRTQRRSTKRLRLTLSSFTRSRRRQSPHARRHLRIPQSSAMTRTTVMASSTPIESSAPVEPCTDAEF